MGQTASVAVSHIKANSFAKFNELFSKASVEFLMMLQPKYNEILIYHKVQ